MGCSCIKVIEKQLEDTIKKEEGTGKRVKISATVKNKYIALKDKDKDGVLEGYFNLQCPVDVRWDEVDEEGCTSSRTETYQFVATHCPFCGEPTVEYRD